MAHTCPRVWHSSTPTAHGQCWTCRGTLWEGRALTAVLWGQGYRQLGWAGFWGLQEEVRGGGSSSWQQHPTCSLAVTVAEGFARGQAGAPCLSQNHVPCQKPFVSDVWLLNPVLPGLEVGGERGGWEGAGRLLRAGSTSQSWRQPQLSKQGLPPAWDVGSAGGVPSTPRRPWRGKPLCRDWSSILSCIPHTS